MQLKGLISIGDGKPFEGTVTISPLSDAEIVADVYSLTAAAGLHLSTTAIQAALYQDDDAHENCSLTACLDPLHPGPCKGWKGNLFKAAPAAWHALEAAKVDKANTARLKKIDELKAKGLPIPKKLLTPHVAKPHPHAGQTADKASGGAHEAGKEVAHNAGVHLNAPGKVTLGQATKTVTPSAPVETGPKGKKPTLGSKGIAFVIGQEKVTPQYKLDKAAAITPGQWAGLPEADKSSIRGELAKIQKDGFGPQQKKATDLLDKLTVAPAEPAAKPTLAEVAKGVGDAANGKVAELLAKHEAGPPKITKLSDIATPKTAIAESAKIDLHTPLHPGEPLSAKNYTPAMKSATDAASMYANPPKIHALQMGFLERFKAYQKLGAEEWKALPEGTKTTIVKDVIGISAGDQMLHQGFMTEDGKAFTPASAWLARRNIELPALEQKKIDKFVPQFSKGKPVKPSVQVGIPEKTHVEAKNVFGEHSKVTKVTHPQYGAAASKVEATPEMPAAKIENKFEKPKDLPKHVQHAMDMADGKAANAAWSKNHLVAYQALTADEFHALSPDHQAKIAAELEKAKVKFLDPKKQKAAADLLEKFGHGQGAPKAKAPDKPSEQVGMATHLHDHTVSEKDAKEAVAKASITAHFYNAKQVAGLTDTDNPDHVGHLPNAQAGAMELTNYASKMYDSSITKQPEVKQAEKAFNAAATAELHARIVADAKKNAYNKISTKLSADDGKLSPIEKASLKHYQDHLLKHPMKTGPDDIAALNATTMAAKKDLTDKLQAALKEANAPKPEDMSGAMLDSKAKELLGSNLVDPTKPKVSLSLAETQHAKNMGIKIVQHLAQDYPATLLHDPAVAAKLAAVQHASTQHLMTASMQGHLKGHIKQLHDEALLSGKDLHGNPLSAADKKIIELHAAKLEKDHAYLGTSAQEQLKKLDDAKAQFKAAADKAVNDLKPATTLSDTDKAYVSDAYASAWAAHTNKAVNYGVKTYDQQGAFKTHPEYSALTQDLGSLKTLAGKLAVAHAEEHAAQLSAEADGTVGSPEWKAWQGKIHERQALTKEFGALHAQAQKKLDTIRVAVGLKKRALPKLDTAAVKATAAESGFNKTSHFGGVNHGKPESAKGYMLAKAGPAIGVKHQTASDKSVAKEKAKLGDVAAAPAPSVSKIENVAPSAAPVKLGGADTIAHIPDPLKKQITSDFKGMPKGKYLADPAEDVFDNLVNLAAGHGKAVPGGLSVDQVLKTIDETHSKNLGTANAGMLHKKITDWLGTAAGKKYAEDHSTPDAKVVKQINGEVTLPKGVTLAPGEKVQKVAGPGPHDETLAPSAFKHATTPQAQAAQDAYMKASGVKWTPEQKSALKSYTGSAYTTCNNYLRGTGSGSQDTKQKVIDIQSAMLPLPEHTLLRRGTGWSALPAGFQGANAHKMIGKTFQEPGFTSTTVAGESGHFSGPLQLEIEAPKGTAAAFVNGLSHYKGQENEMLLAAGTKFKVLSVEVKGGKTVMRVRVVGDK